MSVFTRSISSSTLNEIFGLGKNVWSSDEELIHELRMVQEDNEQCHLLCDEFEDGNIELRDQIEKLEKENKKLTVLSCTGTMYMNYAHMQDLEKENKELKTSLQCVKQLRKEHIELKKENEKLKEEIDGDKFWGLNVGYKTELSNSHKQLNRMVKEIVKLKKENEKLKTSLQFIKTTLTQPVPPS